ncbi:hypothetical protein Jab_1c22250 [Janthinobacterium sp. HH01]|uniref:DUF2726 domain-containing protein n=1 Tax=Janthinobacterium sp. HH01 TaxID=1198452 RepID=UPI0002AEC0A3|nr:DUF2726 domain-containing protein [Janthinobacterium sp. HH01]ELX13589.1 hypothetical protein Jab_1c22250 [Janthinobacterium sp. HH01]
MNYQLHTRDIFREPRILDEIKTRMCWPSDRFAQYEAKQTSNEPKNNFSTEPGYFASDPEFRFYSVLRRHASTPAALLLSNIPLAEIFSVDTQAFEHWYANKNFYPRSLQESRKTFGELIGKKAVDIVVVDKQTKNIMRAYEVDGPAHQSEANNRVWDLSKNFLFRQHHIPLLRISSDSATKLYTQSNGSCFPDTLDQTLQLMSENWAKFCAAPSEETMHSHFSTPLVP